MTELGEAVAIAMIGLPKSASPMPVARQSARAPVMFRPTAVVRLGYRTTPGG